MAEKGMQFLWWWGLWYNFHEFGCHLGNVGLFEPGDSVILQHLGKIKTKLHDEIAAADPTMLTSCPVETYVDHLVSMPKYLPYPKVREWILQTCSPVSQVRDVSLLALFHKLVLLCLIESLPRRHPSPDLPEYISQYYKLEFERIIQEFESNPDEYYVFGNDHFLKDLNICTSLLIPVGGTRVIQISSLPRGFALKPESWWFICIKLGGFAPIFDAHVSLRSVGRFDAQGQIHYFVAVADLLHMNREVKGLVGKSWYFDPQLEYISPHLTYLRRLPEENGARFFRAGSFEYSIKHATAKSTTRRKLFEKGSYLPTDYYMIWPRKELLKWRAVVTNPR